MTKIFGLVSTIHDEETISMYLQSAARVMSHDVETHKEYITDSNTGVVLLKNPLFDEHQSAWDGSRSSFLALCGHIVDIKVDEESSRRNKYNVSRDHSIAALLGMLNEHNEQILDKINGVFAFAHWDASTRSMTIVNDRYGFMPLYYYYDECMFIFSSEIKAILQVVGKQEIDWESCADFFYIGSMIGEKTLFKNIHAMDTGQSLIYCNGQLTKSTYYDFAKTPVLSDDEVSTDKVASLFIEAVRRRIRNDKLNTVLLSGGFDSRLILGALHTLHVAPKLISLEHADEKGGADGKFAIRVAESLGLACDLRQTQEDFLASADALEAFYILDGMAPTWNLFIDEVYPELSSDLGIVWEGMGLGSALGGSYQTEAGAQHDLQQLMQKHAIRRMLLRIIFHPWLFHRMSHNFIQRMQHEIDKIPVSPNQFLHFVLKHRIRRRIAINPYQLFATKVEPMTPAADLDFMDYVLSIPIRFRRNHRLYIDLLRTQFPLLTKVPVISGGSTYQFENDEFRKAPNGNRVKNLLRNAVKASSMVLQYFKSGSHDTSYDRTFKVIVAILEIKYFDRPIYNKHILRWMFARYRNGHRLYHRLFVFVFYVELWHLLFLEHDSPIFFNPKHSNFVKTNTTVTMEA